MAQGSADSTLLDVDHMIIDFLEYQAICKVFKDYENQRRAFKHNRESPPITSFNDMQLVDSFLVLFKRNHSHQALEPASGFRLKLLQFSAVFVQRSVTNIAAPSEQALRGLRINSGGPSSTFAYSSSPSPLRRSAQEQLPIADKYRIDYWDRLDRFGVNGSHPSLLDLQPLFLRLSAARAALKGDEATIKESWMHFAGEFMLQAAMEQLMVHGAKDAEVLKEIFSWKWAGLDLDEMFEAQGQEDIAQWDAIRREWAGKLNPPSRSTSLGRHLLDIAKQFPLHRFERRMLNFLEACHSSLTTPVLIQAENGQFEGMSLQDSEEVLRRAGIRFR